MPKVAQTSSRGTKARQSAAKKKPAARKRRPARRIARRQAGSLERLGHRLDQSGALIATGAFQLALFTVIAGGLFVFMLSLFSGQLGSFPAKIAAAPEVAARSLGMNVMTVTLKGGDQLATRDVMAALRDDKRGSIIGRPLLLLDTDELRTRLLALKAVKDISVHKLFPDTLHISVTTRVPKALYQNAEGAFFVIDADGSLIEEAKPTDYTQLPVISGTDKPLEAVPFLTLLRRHPVLYARTAGIEVVGGRRIDLRFRNGFHAKLPEKNVEKALARLQSLDAGTGSLAENLTYLDLRNPDWAYFQPKKP
ncbi:MAG: cell division protein FtsQ/DivIB [Pseudomonadota bacterium]